MYTLSLGLCFDGLVLERRAITHRIMSSIIEAKHALKLSANRAGVGGFMSSAFPPAGVCA